MNSFDLISFRRELHKYPELSGQEKLTSEKILSILEKTTPDAIIRNLSGHGLAFVYKGINKGPLVMFRADMDALPISETSKTDHVSVNNYVSHSCGHDGHMSILTGLGLELGINRPLNCTVVLLFQPSEETGKGAAQVISDPQFASIEPDYIFAIHNLPGYPLHQVITKTNVFCCASGGMRLTYKGKTSHAAEPEKGLSPAHALAYIINEVDLLPEDFENYTMTTITYAKLGEKSYGISPGELEVQATFRAHRDKDMKAMCFIASESMKEIGRAEKLDFCINWEEIFPTTINSHECIRIVEKSAHINGLKINRISEPFKWSEDFGFFTQKYKGALIGIGAGEDHPALHNPDYDFPDEIIETGVKLFKTILESWT